ncbi:MAG: hypothetical protein HKN03_00060, partial [Acidimicrobiales bacterium]|nr:hypothetical protein [Acidimicrobiales bacterium]
STGASVVAVELLDAVNVLPEVVRANGYSDRVQVYRGDIREVELEPFDLVISDLRGNVPLFGDNVDVLAYVHRHLLKAGGVLLPFRDEIRAAMVSLPERFERAVRPWQSLDSHDWSAYRRLALAAPTRIQEVPGHAVISEAVTIATINYHDLDSLALRKHRFKGTVAATKAGDAHGFIVWFDALITEDIGFTTEPGEATPTYGRKFLPFQSPVALTVGDEIDVSIATLRVDDDWQWQWQTGRGQDRQMQSSLDALPLVAGDLAQVYGAAMGPSEGGGSNDPAPSVQRLL